MDPKRASGAWSSFMSRFSGRGSRQIFGVRLLTFRQLSAGCSNELEKFPRAPWPLRWIWRKTALHERDKLRVRIRQKVSE